jgi:hypothetical protein
MQTFSFPIPLSVDPQLNPRKSFLNGTADSDEYGDTADERPPLHFFARSAAARGERTNMKSMDSLLRSHGLYLFNLSTRRMSWHE